LGYSFHPFILPNLFTDFVEAASQPDYRVEFGFITFAVGFDFIRVDMFQQDFSDE